MYNPDLRPMNIEAAAGSSLLDSGGDGVRRINSMDDEHKHLYVLPVLFLEFLALALTRAVLPSKLLRAFGSQVYLTMGAVEFVRGILAFFSSPFFGRLSDKLGRRVCLCLTVFGTCLPVCSLLFVNFYTTNYSSMSSMMFNTSSPYQHHSSQYFENTDHDHNWKGSLETNMNNMQQQKDDDNDSSSEWIQMRVFIVLLALSGCFSATFTLVFAYISDCVPGGNNRERDNNRVAAYGLALATFGLSFTIGPMAGGYLARDNHEVDGYYNKRFEGGGKEDGGNNNGGVSELGEQRVFLCSFLLVLSTMLYLIFVLPETVDIQQQDRKSIFRSPTRRGDRRSSSTEDIIHRGWNPFDALRVFSGDPLLSKVGQIVLLYYTGVYAVVSTLTLYAVKRFNYGPDRLGELMSSLGMCTMVSEIILVRLIVPTIGEKKSLKIGLVAFAMQCLVLGLASEGWHLFVCVGLSMVANLTYPSLTSIVSNAVAPEAVGEALGSVNGVKALSEGVGPLVFGSLLTVSEDTFLPGWPYILAGSFALLAYKVSQTLPEDEYINEKYNIKKKVRENDSSKDSGGVDKIIRILSSMSGTSESIIRLPSKQVEEVDDFEEIKSLLSEVEEDVGNSFQAPRRTTNEGRDSNQFGVAPTATHDEKEDKSLWYYCI